MWKTDSFSFIPSYKAKITDTMFASIKDVGADRKMTSDSEHVLWKSQSTSFSWIAIVHALNIKTQQETITIEPYNTR